MKKIFLFFVLFFVFGKSYSQIGPIDPPITTFSLSSELPVIVPPSPTVANLMQFEEVQVDEYSGQPNIDFPLFNKELAPNLNMNLNLQYKTSGIRVKQRSSWVGTGWSLFAGGTISRTVMGKPDETLITGILNNDYYNWDLLTNDAKQKYAWEAINQTTNGTLDTDPDLYQFNFLGRSGRFIIVKQNGVLKPILLSLDEKLKIGLEREFDVATNQLSNSILKFTITDEYGYIYEFSEREFSQTTSVISSVSHSGTTSGGPTGNGGTDLFASYYSAWHLTKIKTSNTLDLATLSYKTVVENITNPGSLYSTRIIGNPSFGSNSDYNKGLIEPRLSYNSSSSIIQSKKLTQILFNKDNSKVIFNTEAGHPETNGERLKNLQIYNQNNKNIDSYVFNYILSNPVLKYNDTGKRLYLDEIKQIKNNITLTNKLSYYKINELPGYDSDDKDGFGYHFQGIDTKLDDVKKGVLTKIEYPTGGGKEFDFESNTYSFVGENLIDPKDISENHYYANFNDVFSYNVYNPNQFNDLRIIYIGEGQIAKLKINEIITAPENNFDFNGFHMRITPVTLTPENQAAFDPDCVRLCYFPNSREEFAQPMYGVTFKITTANHNVNLGEGFYFIELVGNDVLSPGDGIVSVNFDFNYRTYGVRQLYAHGGGLRIKKIDFIDENKIKRSVEYNYDLDNGSIENIGFGEYSSGSVDINHNKTKEYPLTRQYAFANLIQHIGLTEYRRFLQTISFMVRRGSDGLPAEMTKGNYVGYKNIRKSEIGNGYIKSIYTSPIDFSTYDEDYGYPFLPVKDISYKHGLLLQRDVFDESNRILKSTINTDNEGNFNYNFIENPVYTSRHFNVPQLQNCAWDKLFIRYENFKLNRPDIFDDSPHNYNTQFDNCGGQTNALINTQNHYANTAQLRESTIKDYFYLDGSTTPNIVETKKTYNYNNSNLLMNEENTFYLEKGQETHYQNKYYYSVGNGLPPIYTSAVPINRLRTLNKINEVIATETFKDGEKLNQTNTYYNEFEPNLVLPETVTASKAEDEPEERIKYHRYDNYGNPLEVSQTKGKSISYIWGYNQTYPIAKIENLKYSAIEALPEFGNGFVISEGLTPVQETALRSIENAMVTTYTYDPLVGVTSMTDPKGYTMFYEYDEFNRLKHVKDQNGDLLSKNEYKYATQN